ncbi:hypothetical protein [Pseudomaricurvus sp. HS19]|uniref:hypothetical protein n=1 Tax=Pseudomaricurvus sp. HS19 TaxID=2692626 RepID=UPI001368FA51|nr:hypothetical protein [Pseudomaricurvus sp. HS19]MYM62253.1 hypothetical protein [Pseudomaricurvus sp. HS19]
MAILAFDLQAQTEGEGASLSAGTWAGEYDLAGIDDVPVTLTLNAGDDGLEGNIEFAGSKSYDANVVVDDSGLVSVTFGRGGDRHQCELRFVGGERMRGDCVSAGSDKATLNLTRVEGGSVLPDKPVAVSAGIESKDGESPSGTEAETAQTSP